MADQNDSKNPEQNLDEMIERLEQLDPLKMALMSPEEIQALLGGVKLGDIQAQIQRQAETLADQMGVDLNSLDDDEDDDWFDDEEESLSEEDLQAFLARPTGPDGSLDDFPGSQQLWEAVQQLRNEERLQVLIEIKSPPVTRIEKIYYSECHYQLSFDLFDNKATFRDVNTPRQDYLDGNGWPAMLLLPRKSWPDLEPLWDTIKVQQYNLQKAIMSNKQELTACDDLVPFAKQALESALSK